MLSGSPKLERCEHKLGVLQRILVPYRAPLFDALAARCEYGASVFAGAPSSRETVRTADGLGVSQLERGRNYYLLGGPLAVHWQRGVLNWLDAWQPDILVAEANPRSLSTPAAARWMRQRSRPVLGWGMGAYSVTPQLAHIRAFHRRRYLGLFDGMIAYSSRAAAEYCAAGFPSCDVFVANNAVAHRPTGPPPARAGAFAGMPIVLFVGRLTHEKRLDLLMEACGHLERVRPSLSVDLRIVGSGQARQALEDKARGAYPSTRFLGAMYGKELSDQFRRADIFVLPNLGGLAVQEAMSHGLPVIVGAGDGTQEDLVRPENGWHFRSASAADLAALLRIALSDVAKLREMGAASFEIVSHEINLDVMTAQIVRAINETVVR